MNSPGAITLFRAAGASALAKHLTAETKTDQFVVDKGVVVKRERRRRQNQGRDAAQAARPGRIVDLGKSWFATLCLRWIFQAESRQTSRNDRSVDLNLGTPRQRT